MSSPAPAAFPAAAPLQWWKSKTVFSSQVSVLPCLRHWKSSMQPCSAQATRAVEEACVARCCVTSACARKLSSCSSAPTRACRLLNSHASFMYKLSSMTEHPHPSSLTLPFRCVRPRRHTCHVHLSTGLSMRKMMAIRLKAHEAAQGRLLGVPPP